MTRVWKAREISNFGGAYLSRGVVALKDVWLDKDAKTERKIQEEIFEAVEDAIAQKDQDGSRLKLVLDSSGTKKTADHISTIIENYKNYFMNIECDQEGMITKDKHRDAHPKAGLFSPSEQSSVQKRSRQITGADPARNRGSPLHPSPSHTQTTEQNSDVRKFLAKKRYLVVFSDVGEALHDITDFGTTFSALKDIVSGESIIPFHRHSLLTSTEPC